MQKVSRPNVTDWQAISRRRQIYAMIGMELRTHGEIFVKWGDFRQILKTEVCSKTHLHMSPIVVKMSSSVCPNDKHG